MAETNKYDLLIVGAGFAGSTAALTAAKSGLSVALFDHSQFAGTKIVLGNLFISTAAANLIDDFENCAPLERYVKQQAYCVMSKESSLSLEFDSENYNPYPHNNLWTINRTKFDPWYARLSTLYGAKL